MRRQSISLCLAFICSILLMFVISARGYAAFPVTVVDDIGRNVVIGARPERIVSLVPSHTETLYALGAEGQIAAVDDFSDWPQAVSQKPKVGSLTGVNFEQVLALDADLVVAMEAHVNQGVVEKLELLDITVLVLEPQSLQQTYKTIELLGTVTGRNDQARAIVRNMQAQVQSVLNRLQTVTPRRVFYEVWNEPLMTAGPGSFIHELMGMAKGANIARDAASAWPMFSLEALLARDPEVIITPFTQTVADIKSGQRSTWASVAAVRSGRVYFIDQNIISRPGPRLSEGLETLARLIFPEVF